jgi:hypothetical protein
MSHEKKFINRCIYIVVLIILLSAFAQQKACAQLSNYFKHGVVVKGNVRILPDGCLILGSDTICDFSTITPLPYYPDSDSLYVAVFDSNGFAAYINVANLGGGGGTIQDADSLYIRAANEGTLVGDARGLNSVDLQTSRIVGTQVASAPSSVVGGGKYNTASGENSVVDGGILNIASGDGTVIGGGENNYAIGTHYSVISGGSYNENLEQASSIGGGQYNQTKGAFSTITGGLYNIAATYGETVVGVFSEDLTTADYASINSWVSTDPLFRIGNGINSGSGRSDALVVLKNGNTTINGNLKADTARVTVLEINGKLITDIDTLGGLLTSSGAKTATFTHKADSFEIGAYTLSTANAVVINIHNLNPAAGRSMQGTIFLDIATNPASIGVNTFSDAGTTGLTEEVLGSPLNNAANKSTSITYTCTNNGTSTKVYLIYGQEN